MDRIIVPLIVVLAVKMAGIALGAEVPWAETIAEASRRFAIPEPWIRSVIQAESAGQPERAGRPITSPAGAIGLTRSSGTLWPSPGDLFVPLGQAAGGGK